jgi:DNA-binding transcriptional LysR family regulator
MELRHLRAATILAEELHFGRTAKRLRVAQSAVSLMIKTLEQDVGVVLFARTKRTVALTPAGRAFVAGARKVLDDLSEVGVEARRVATGDSGHLHLRFITMSTLTDVPGAVDRFRRRYPAVSVRVEPGSSVEQLDALRGGRCDIGFMAWAAGKGDLAPLRTRLVARSPMVALLSKQHRLARRRSLRLEELATDPFVFLTLAEEPQINLYFRRRCLAAGFDPQIAVEVQHADALLAFIAAGFGVSCAPGFIRRLQYEGVVAVPLTPVFHAGIVAVWHPERISATGRRFLEMLPEV